jgi:hypothetical protein
MARLTEKPVFGRQGLEPGYATSADCRFLWWSSEGPGIRRFAENARKLIDDRKAEFFMSFVSPGFDDTGVWGWNNKPRVSERKGLSLLRGTFDNAFAGDPELVQMVTWNDFQEGTVFEPTHQDGYLYLDALATWWAAKKGRPAPSTTSLRAPFQEYARTCSAAEQAELPPAPIRADILRPRPLTVADPELINRVANPSGI